jgi:hypothetical protein
METARFIGCRPIEMLAQVQNLPMVLHRPGPFLHQSLSSYLANSIDSACSLLIAYFGNRVPLPSCPVLQEGYNLVPALISPLVSLSFLCRLAR